MSMNVLCTAKDLSDRTKVVEQRLDEKGRTVSISNEHYNVHHGKLYGIGYYNASVANGSSIQLIYTTPVGTDLHASITVKAGGDATMQIYEGVTYTGGTTVTPQNQNRCFPNASVVTSVHTPTTVPTSTLVWQEYVPGGAGGITPGGTATTDEQGVFCENSTYMIELTNTSGVAAPLNIVISYYEAAHG